MDDDEFKKELMKKVQALAKKLGRTPTSKEFENYTKIPHRFGTWNNFLKKAGLKPNLIKNDFNNMPDEEVLLLVKNELLRIGSTTYADYSKHKSNKTPSPSYIGKRFGLKWNELLQKLNLETNLEIMTDDELLQRLIDVAKEIGKTPSITDLTSRGIAVNVYQTRYNGYNNALKLAGLEVNHEMTKVTHTNEELIEMYVNLCKQLGKAATSRDIDENLPYSNSIFAMRFGSVNELRKLAGYNTIIRKRRYSRESIKKILIKKYKEMDRRLTDREIKQLSKQDEDFPSLDTICRHFKTTKMSEVWKEIEKDI